jgi:hypothetical protein
LDIVAKFAEFSPEQCGVEQAIRGPKASEQVSHAIKANSQCSGGSHFRAPTGMHQHLNAPTLDSKAIAVDRSWQLKVDRQAFTPKHLHLDWAAFQSARVGRRLFLFTHN